MDYLTWAFHSKQPTNLWLKFLYTKIEGHLPTTFFYGFWTVAFFSHSSFSLTFSCCILSLLIAFLSLFYHFFLFLFVNYLIAFLVALSPPFFFCFFIPAFTLYRIIYACVISPHFCISV